MSPSIDWLIAARALQGVGGAIVTPLTLTILSDAVPAERRGLALGLWGGVSGLGVALGPLVGGAVVQGLSWQWIFWLNVPIGLAVIPLGMSRPARELRPGRPARRDRRRPHHRVGARPRVGPRSGPTRAAGRAPRSSLSLDRGRRAPRRVRRLGAPRTRADAADAVLPEPRLRGRERRVAPHVLRDVRVDLPADPVPPERAGELAARGRPADAAVDGHADDRRPDRRRADRPDRRAAAARRPGWRSRRPRSRGSRRSPRPTWRTSTSCRRS